MLRMASTVMARPGTRFLFSTPSCLIVIPSLAMPKSAREPSIVAVFIDSTRPATTQTTRTLPSAVPTSSLNAVVKNAMKVVSPATVFVPSVPPRPSGSSA
jgi:hypothetical protein